MSAKDAWDTQCLKRGVVQRGTRWEGDPPVEVPNMVPNEASRTLPTREASGAFEDECAVKAAAEGITTTEYRERLCAALRAQMAAK